MFNKKFFNLPGEIATGYYTIISFHKQTCLLSMAKQAYPSTVWLSSSFFYHPLPQLLNWSVNRVGKK
ncbi:hypothetical protein T06_8779 [Trichinella sp. T6]|nr:hypothetical protein T06_8779 [Trichinella sp. T6]